MRLVWLLPLILLAAVVCHSDQSTNATVLVADKDYHVYSAHLNAFKFYRNVPAQGIIIYDSTTIWHHDIHPATPWSWVTSNLGDYCHYFCDTVRCQQAQDPAWEAMFDTLKRPAYHHSLPLQAKFKVRWPTQVCSREELRKYYETNDSRLLHTYTFFLSNIIYNADQTKALFFSSYSCKGNCGRGELILMEKIDQTWSLVDRFRFWIA